MTNLISVIKKNLKFIIPVLIILLIALGSVLYFRHQANLEAERYRELLDNITLSKEYTKELANQNKLVASTVNDLRNNKEVKETVTNNYTDTIKYIEKESPSDPDLVIDREKSVKLKYNGETFNTPLQTSKATSVAKDDGTVEVKQRDEVVIDVTDIANRQIAAHELMRDKIEEELNNDIKKLKHENRNLKIAGVVVGVTGVGYLVHKASK